MAVLCNHASRRASHYAYLRNARAAFGPKHRRFAGPFLCPHTNVRANVGRDTATLADRFKYHFVNSDDLRGIAALFADLPGWHTYVWQAFDAARNHEMAEIFVSFFSNSDQPVAPSNYNSVGILTLLRILTGPSE